MELEVGLFVSQFQRVFTHEFQVCFDFNKANNLIFRDSEFLEISHPAEYTDSSHSSITVNISGAASNSYILLKLDAANFGSKSRQISSWQLLFNCTGN